MLGLTVLYLLVQSLLQLLLQLLLRRIWLAVVGPLLWLLGHTRLIVIGSVLLLLRLVVVRSLLWLLLGQTAVLSLLLRDPVRVVRFLLLLLRLKAAHPLLLLWGYVRLALVL